MMNYEKPNIQIIIAKEDDIITESLELPELPLYDF